MKLRKKNLIFSVLLIGSVSISLYAQNGTLGKETSTTNRVITTSVPFLLIAPDSRMGAMGEVSAATLDDPNAQHWNASKYAFSKNTFGTSLSYSPWLSGLGVNDIKCVYLSGYGKVTDVDFVSASLRYFSMGEMMLTDVSGADIMPVRAHEYAIDASYIRKFTKEFSMAVTGRFIYSNLASISGMGTQDMRPGKSGAADISLLYTKKLSAKAFKESSIAYGLNISNIGAKISYSDDLKRNFLPANFKAGLAYTMNFDGFNRMTLAFDVNKLLVTTPPIYQLDSISGEYKIIDGRDPYATSAAGAVFSSWADAPGGFSEEMKEFLLNFGVEYVYDDLLFLRAGYLHETKMKGNRKYATVGVGIKYTNIGIDASYIWPISSQPNPLDHTLRFTLSLAFK